MIKVENLSMLFSTEEVQTKALNEVTFEIGKGEFVAIMGPSGCGKSTLLNILGTLDTPTSGSYLFEGKRVDKMNENLLTALRKGSIGFIFQSFNLIDSQTTVPKRRSSLEEPCASALATITNTSTGATPFSAPTNRLPNSSIHAAPGQIKASTEPITRPIAMRRIRLVELYLAASVLAAFVS